jgi:ParB family chromosome partitioning protein
MAGFMREILNTLSYDPPSAMANVEASALSRLDQRLAGLTPGTGGAKAVIKLRPRECDVWNGNPRDVPGLNAVNCRSLIESIAAEGGNRIPVLVRATAPGSALPYELLVGSRRRFSVDWLNHNGRPEIFLNALVVELTDEEAFRLADIENRERQDISELDRARSYQAAVDRFYAGIQSRMAEALGLSNSQLSRLLSLAQMPDEVVNAFATREDLRVRHSEVLTPLLRRAEQRELLLVAANEVAGEQQLRAGRNEKMIPAAAVLARLKRAAVTEPVEYDRGGPLVVSGETIGRIKGLKAGGLAVEFTVGVAASVEDILEELRDAIENARGAGKSKSEEARHVAQ